MRHDDQAADEAKYLGVFFDRKLSFRQHIQYAAKKGTKFALVISRIANCTRGPAFHQTRILFTSVAAPRMDYAALVWYKPSRGGRPRQCQTSIAKLDAAQRTAIKAILGTFRTTSTSALQVETSLMPTHLRLRYRVLQSWTRMPTMPETHPIISAIRRAITSRSTVCITLLEHLARTFPSYATDIETIQPYPFPPWWIPPFTIKIEIDKKTARRMHDATRHTPDTICIYTDGSGIDGHIGAAAVSLQTACISRRYLRTDDEHNVYIAEIAGLELATEIARATPLSFTKCVIYMDSQAAIRGVNKPSKQSGQANLISAIINLQLLSDERQMATEIRWVPSHEDVDGNEKADKAAKEAAQSQGNDLHIPKSTHKPLKSARTVCIKRDVTKEWDEAWQSDTPNDARQLRRITKKPNNLCGKKLYNNIELPQHQIATLAQLRTGHCSLNQYLHRFGHAESPLCECGSGAIENVEHYLLHCPRYDMQRSKLLKEVGVCGMRLEKLLGRRWTIRYTLKYVKETARLAFK